MAVKRLPVKAIHFQFSNPSMHNKFCFMNSEEVEN